jgi:hypothetical protein
MGKVYFAAFLWVPGAFAGTSRFLKERDFKQDREGAKNCKAIGQA